VPSGLDALAFERHGDWTVVVVDNNGPGVAPARLRLAWPGGEGARCTGAFRTSATQDLAPVACAGAGADDAVQVPSQSVTTYTFVPA